MHVVGAVERYQPTHHGDKNRKQDLIRVVAFTGGGIERINQYKHGGSMWGGSG